MESSFGAIFQACNNIKGLPSHSLCPTHDIVTYTLHMQLALGKNVESMADQGASFYGPKAQKDMRKTLESKLGNRVVTAFSGRHCIDMLKQHEAWSIELKNHPQHAEFVLVLDSLREISRISLASFDKHSPLIAEFETAAANLRRVVTRSFNGRKGQGVVDKDGYVCIEGPCFTFNANGALVWTPLGA